MSTCATTACSRCEALLQVRQQVKPYLDLQLVAFPQDGVLRSPGALANLKRALDLGVDVVGGIPHFERTMADGAESACACCASWPPSAACASTCTATRATTRCRATSRRWPSTTQRLGLHGRVTGSHLTSMHSMDNYYASKLIAADRRSAGCMRSPTR